MCNVPSGAEAYGSLYAASSSDGVLRLGNIVPDFTADTTHGPMKFHEWIDGSWAILFSHPADFTPVCTTEIGRLALKYDELKSKGVKLATLSCDPVESHTKWLDDVVAHCENKVTIDFPIIADPTREIAVKYGMIDPELKDKEGLPLTCRAVFIIGPDKKLKLSLNYPASVGRNMDEITRVIDALQLSAKYSVATPANWPNNHESIGKKGQAFLLPTVTPEDAKKYFPNHTSCLVPSGIDYLRLTPIENLSTK
ncbi:glutathione peroxidase [Coccomyxa subellipsoidea C-169]|uniref:Peroxiredoxin n=1 Tax=Coccomyxa subellipsoidea (strain C-169) TaxID=574566 RepID=I0YYP3_COCSC|nr:glutathione peroxidase [Coccomyxa subellipsoidea C-169]EIE23512.1 glutathione peroxidase [Coccomyxa subellipsoidea C-169]|eukprot:XP_005648056.1 glutathione peroxidase [Coccomyxa subellipsoidea C-169]